MTENQGKKKTARILIVEDTETSLQALSFILSTQNYEILQARNGMEAIEISKNEIPDLILLDINMPEMDGYETCTNIKINPITQEIPVIFITALVDLENISQGFEVGGSDYITKPYKNSELLARVKTHLELKKSKEFIENQNIELKDTESKLIEMSQDLISVNSKLKESQTELVDLKRKINSPTYEKLFNQKVS